MAFAGDAERPHLVETGVVSDVWIDGIGKIEHLGGGTFRFLLYKVHRPVNGEGPCEHDVVLAVLCNTATIRNALPALLALAGESVMQVVGLLQ